MGVLMTAPRSREASKTRLDVLVVERGLAGSRQQAQGLILAGQVLVDGQKVAKCGASVSAEAALRLVGQAPLYVSRGGVKLAAALDRFGVNPAAKVCLDVGASTGGFTDCLLQRGARRIIALDVGTNQLDWKLRQDPRVVSRENTNARYLEPAAVGEPIDLVTVDVSFISATLILPVIPALLKPQAEVLVLAKPQFEVGRGQVGKGGVVRDEKLRQEAVARVADKLDELGFTDIASASSVLPGAAGNVEYFVYGQWEGGA